MHTIFVDGYKDVSKHIFGMSVLRKNDDDYDTVVCFDIRNARAIGRDSLGRKVVDIALLYEHDENLKTLTRRVGVPSFDSLSVAEMRLTAHTKAIKEAKIDVENISLEKLIPSDVLNEYVTARIEAIKDLYDAAPIELLREYEDRTSKVIEDVLKVEASKIHVDEALLGSLLKDKNVLGHERSFLEHIRTLTRDGFAKTRISPVGSKTKRFRVVGGLKSMSIPHGAPRRVLTSRFEGGEIHVIDFNAIDYRCIIEAVGSQKLTEFYGSSDDFHSKTASLFGGDRKVAKDLTYVHIYGGSIESVAKKTTLGIVETKRLVNIVDEFLQPVVEFRKNLAASSRKAGCVVTPSGYKVPVSVDDSDGKIVGLYAQTYSSSVFEIALHAALEALKNLRSKVILTVHDEITFDVHPEEFEVVEEIKKTIERKTGFKTKLKKGRSYGEATDT